MRRLGLALALLLLAAAPAAARKVLREVPVAEIPIAGGIVPAAFAVDAGGRVTVADDGAGALVHFDAGGRITGRTSLIRHPALSRFHLQDLCLSGATFYVLETVNRSVLVVEEGKTRAEVALPDECVRPLRVGLDPAGRLVLADAHSARTLVLDAKGAVVARSDERLDESNVPRTLFARWRPEGDDGKGIALAVSATADGAATEVYKLFLPAPLAGASLLGAGADGDLYVRATAGFGLDLKQYVVRVSPKGSKKFQIEYSRFAEFPAVREMLLGADQRLYAVRRFPESTLIVRLDEETAYLEEPEAVEP